LINRNIAKSVLGALALLLAITCFFSGAGLATPILTADTSSPNLSTFVLGKPVTLTFSVTGLSPGQPETLIVDVQNELGNHVGHFQSPVVGDTTANWQTSWLAPHGKLGFYRVYCKLSDGTKIPALGSRQAGYITYCIVPDPANRAAVTQSTSRFGMQGGYNYTVNVMPYLGIHWFNVSTFTWSSVETNYSGQMHWATVTPYSTTYNGKPWPVYPIFSPFYSPPAWATVPGSKGLLTASGQTAWSNYCTAVAKCVAASYPGLTRDVYQVTWEPNFSTTFSGTPAQLASVYQTAYANLHANDPNAVVIGPAGGPFYGSSWLPWYQSQASAGLGKYIDGLSIHAYFEMLGINSQPFSALAQDIHALKSAYAGKAGLTYLGTEQGFSTNGLESNELQQAEVLSAENLMMLGEGFSSNMMFYIVDFPGNTAANGFGCYYDLTAPIVWGPTKTGPKPIAPVYAAQSNLLEGYNSDGAIPNLSTGEYGYIFQQGQSIVLALWSDTDQGQSVSLPVGASSVNVVDWMGNATPVQTPNGQVTVTLSPRPVYVTGASASTWGNL
jgi:hypothetical protein